MKSVSKILLGCFAVLALVPSISRAAAVTFAIDPTQSYMDMNVVLEAGPPIGPLDVSTVQFPGSDRAVPVGSFQVDRTGDVDFGEIGFLGGAFTYTNNATPMAPSFLPNGTTIEPAPQPPGSDPAQWGFNSNVFGGIVGPTALRSVQTSVTGANQGMFFGAFDPTVLTLNLLAAHNDFSYVGDGLPAFGIDPIDEQTGLDLAPSAGVNATGLFGQLSVVDGVEQIYVPIQSRVLVFIGDVPAYLDFSGQIIAKAVPEPSSVAIAALGMVGLVAAGYRARKRNA